MFCWQKPSEYNDQVDQVLLIREGCNLKSRATSINIWLNVEHFEYLSCPHFHFPYQLLNFRGESDVVNDEYWKVLNSQQHDIQRPSLSRLCSLSRLHLAWSPVSLVSGSRCEAGEGVLLQWPWILQITPESSVLTPPMLTPAQCFNNPCHIRYLKLYEEAVSSQGRLSPDLRLADTPSKSLWLVTAGLSSAPGSWNVKIYARLAPSPGTRGGNVVLPGPRWRHPPDPDGD